MMYSPRELAEEVGFHTDQVYNVYLPLGCPHERDERKHIQINGKAFLKWYEKSYPKIKLAEGETFCLTCKKGVKIVNPQKQEHNGTVYVLSVCPVCGRKLTKIIERRRRDDGF